MFCLNLIKCKTFKTDVAYKEYTVSLHCRLRKPQQDTFFSN